MQWSAGANAGFSSGAPWTLPRPDFAAVNVAAQQDDPASLLSLYRQLARLRLTRPALRDGSLTPVASASDKVYAYLRVSGEDRILVALNFGSRPQEGVILSRAQSDLPVGSYGARDALTGTEYPTMKVEGDGLIAGYTMPALDARQAVILLLTR
jgi:glycosidase